METATMNPAVSAAHVSPGFTRHGCILPALAAGPRLNSQLVEDIRRRMMLDCCKWDPQIGDCSTLSDFPLILPLKQWAHLATIAEAASAELLAAEAELLRRPDLHRVLGIPVRIRRVLGRKKCQSSAAAARVMRFDFHPTSEGWKISEVNCDVPGGFTESSSFTRFMSAHYAGVRPAGDPLAAWANSIAAAAGTGGGCAVALLAAPGYLKDLQIMACLAGALLHRGISSHLAHPRQLQFHDGHAFLKSDLHDGEVGAIVRFYQAEWLGALPRKCHWPFHFVGSRTPIANPATSILTETKRLPLVFGELQTSLATFARHLPQTVDPRLVNWAQDEGWIVKSALCNTGDTVCMRELMPAPQWRRIIREIFWHPRGWVAQRRFQALAIDSPDGDIFPCLGVYTVNGTAAGIYGRYAHKPLIDFEAVDVAVLVTDQPAQGHVIAPNNGAVPTARGAPGGNQRCP